MSETGVNHYEGMFVFAQARDLGEGVDRLRDIFDRAGAEVLAMSKWDERRFAYPIKKHKRGVYVLTHFTCPAEKLAQIERDCNLSEEILRALILRADHLSEEEMRAHDARDELARDIEERRERAKARAAERAARIAASEAEEQAEQNDDRTEVEAETSAQA